MNLNRIRSRGFNMYVTPECIDSYSNFEPLSSYFTLALYNTSGIFVDVGAHFGYYSLLIASQSHTSQIYSFEPTPITFNILTKNILLNSLGSQIKTHKFAASDKEEQVEMYIPENFSSKSSLYHLLSDRSSSIYTTQTHILDTILMNKHVSFVKIDAEGHEIPIIKGLNTTLQNNHSVSMLIEFHPKNLLSAGYIPEELLLHLYSFGYDLYLIVDYPIYVHSAIENHSKSSVIAKIESINDWVEIIPADGRGNILCIPPTLKKTFKINKLLEDLQSEKYQQLFYPHESINKKVVSLTKTVDNLRSKRNLLIQSYFYKSWQYFNNIKKYIRY